MCSGVTAALPMADGSHQLGTPPPTPNACFLYRTSPTAVGSMTTSSGRSLTPGVAVSCGGTAPPQISEDAAKLLPAPGSSRESSTRRMLSAACRPELLLRLNQLQQEIEARGGHAVLEISDSKTANGEGGEDRGNSDASGSLVVFGTEPVSAPSPAHAARVLAHHQIPGLATTNNRTTTRSAMTSRSAVSACQLTPADSHRQSLPPLSTLSHLESPRLWRSVEQWPPPSPAGAQQQRRLDRPPSAPTRLDSMKTPYSFSDSRQYGSGSYGVTSKRVHDPCAVSETDYPLEGDSPLQGGSSPFRGNLREILYVMHPRAPSPISPMPAPVIPEDDFCLSPQSPPWKTPRSLCGSRADFASRNVPPSPPLYGASGSPADASNASGVGGEENGAAGGSRPGTAKAARRRIDKSLRPFRSSPNLELKPHFTEKNSGSDPDSPYDAAAAATTTLRISTSITPSSLPKQIAATPRRYAHRVLSRRWASETSHPPSVGSLSGRQQIVDKSSPHSLPTDNYGSRPFARQQRIITPCMATGGTSAAKGKAPAAYAEREKVASSTVEDDAYETPSHEQFQGTFSVSRRRRGALKHSISSGKTCSNTSPGSEGPACPLPSPRQPTNRGDSGRNLLRQPLNCVPCSPRQDLLRERILGVRYTCIGDRFHISKEKIGEGGSGEIRKCLEWSSGKVFACKTIHKSNITSRKEASDLRSEVLLLDLLKKRRGVVQIHEVFEDHKAIHLVMELCHGGDLFDFIQTTPKGRLTEQQAAAVLKQLLRALNHCHSLGVIHRDVKPENILLCNRVTSQSKASDVKVKLSDFGVAGFVNRDGVCVDTAGTSEYMAPEMARKAAYNAKADIWSAGVVLYAMLSGALPSWASLPDALREQGQVRGTDDGQRRTEGGRTMQDVIMEEKQVALRSRAWASVSGEAKDLLRGMLEKNHHKRLSAAEALGHVWLSETTVNY